MLKHKNKTITYNEWFAIYLAPKSIAQRSSTMCLLAILNYLLNFYRDKLAFRWLRRFIFCETTGQFVLCHIVSVCPPREVSNQFLWCDVFRARALPDIFFKELPLPRFSFKEGRR
jgi:hypothetical protein